MKKLEKVRRIMDGLLFVVINLSLCFLWYFSAKEYPQYSLLNAVAILFYWKYKPIDVTTEIQELLIKTVLKINKDAKRRIEEETGRDDSADKAK